MATMTDATAQRVSKKTTGMPFIMPDGRPLAAFLTESNLIKNAPRHKRGQKKSEPKAGWSSSIPAAWSAPSSSSANDPLTDAERAELAALARVGQRRQRRWLNDKLLRDMGPVLTAADMESLFKPVPFGDTGHVSAFTLAAAPEHAPLFDLFRSVDADKQDRVLDKWAAYVAELRKAAAAGPGGEEELTEAQLEKTAGLAASAAALRGWAGVDPVARRALKRAPRGCVEELEGRVLEAAEVEDCHEILLDVESSYERLLAHGLAKFHGLLSASRNTSGGRREVAVKRPKQRTIAAAAAGELNDTVPAPAGARILCVDVLWLLEERVDGGLSARALHDAFDKHETPRSVEVGAAPAVAGGAFID